MRGLIFLSVRSLKNKLIELLHKPGKLILTFFFVALLVMNLSLERISVSASRPISEFYAIVFIFYILSFITELNKGFSHGGTMFSLSDVSFLFMSPIKPRAVLLYGMMGRLGASLWMGLAFVYQFSLLRSFYPIDVRTMLISVIGYGAVTFLSQSAGMLVYFFTCGDEKKVSFGRRIFYAVISAFAVLFASGCDLGSLSLTSAATALTKPYMMLLPVAGWILAIVRGVTEGKALLAFAGFAASVAFAALTFVILSVSKHGYYEDVLVTAEKNTDPSENGKVMGKRKTAENVSGGIGKGKAESVFYYKHLLENRRAGTVLLSPMSLFYFVMIGVYGFVFKGDAVTLFMLSCMISVHTVLSGRWLKELTMPYIYMVPGSSAKKLFFILPELLPKVICESVLQCLLIAFICKTGTAMTVTFILAKISFSFLLTATALFTSRLMREKEKSSVFVMVCMFSGMLFSVPSIGAAVALIYFGMGTVVAFCAFAIVDVLMGFTVLLMSRNLLKSY